jgi:hypothetical protein
VDPSAYLVLEGILKALPFVDLCLQRGIGIGCVTGRFKGRFTPRQFLF